MTERNDLYALLLDFLRYQDEEKWFLHLKAWERRHRSFLRDLKLSPVYGRLKNNLTWFNELNFSMRKLNDAIPKRIVAWHGWPPQPQYQKDVRFWGVEEIKLNHVFASIEPVLAKLMDEAVLLKNFSLDQMELEPIGVIPLMPVQGFVLLPKNDEVYGVFYYNIQKVYAVSQHLAVDFVPHGTETSGPGISMNDLRWRLIRNVPQRERLAVFLMRSETELPYWHTLRPLAKKKLENWVQSYSAGVSGAASPDGAPF